jgi:hypothetical protein
MFPVDQNFIDPMRPCNWRWGDRQGEMLLELGPGIPWKELVELMVDHGIKGFAGENNQNCQFWDN